MKELGWTTGLEWCEALLSDTNDTRGHVCLQPEIAREFLQQFQRMAYVEMAADISFDEMKSAFKSWRENTSTSPSERHLDHYKSLFALGRWDSKKDGVDPGECILRIHHRML